MKKRAALSLHSHSIRFSLTYKIKDKMTLSLACLVGRIKKQKQKQNGQSRQPKPGWLLAKGGVPHLSEDCCPQKVHVEHSQVGKLIQALRALPPSLSSPSYTQPNENIKKYFTKQPDEVRPGETAIPHCPLKCDSFYSTACLKRGELGRVQQKFFAHITHTAAIDGRQTNILTHHRLCLSNTTVN